MIFLRGERAFSLFVCAIFLSLVQLREGCDSVPERGPSGAQCKYGVACPLYNSPNPCITKTIDVSRFLAKRHIPNDGWRTCSRCAAYEEEGVVLEPQIGIYAFCGSCGLVGSSSQPAPVHKL